MRAVLFVEDQTGQTHIIKAHLRQMQVNHNPLTIATTGLTQVPIANELTIDLDLLVEETQTIRGKDDFEELWDA